ncbi:MAG TPA: transglutaminase domain-containing protein [Candidatus Dormibacteraeota bacterium]|jgi:transglutaminase-like putative cysteine protease|nr:transglutaminase domain-containing protein [Candidatus Dormibacteraeota bacterium]
MKTPIFSGILILGIAAVPAVLLRSATPANSAPSRTFDLTYSAEIHDVPAGAKEVDLWLPYPQSDDYQKVLSAKVNSPFPTKIETASQYGNKMVHLVVKNPTAATIPVTMEFTVERKERVQKNFMEVKTSNGTAPPENLQRWLQSDHLVPLDQRIRELSAEVTAGKKTDVEKARAIYDYVLANMKYDKSGTGWGNGDIYWACDAKRGNCTDFHALFIGLARTAGIPAKFEIGLPLPADKHEGEIAGYHCWAEFYLNGYGWVPVDISEAWKDPARREYFFGAHDANRVQFSIGRDVMLSPLQAGAPLNYFIYPYAEVDGKTFAQVNKKFAFREVGTQAASAN